MATVRPALSHGIPVPPRLRVVVLAALAAGALAALITGLFHLFATEPLVDLASAWEGASHASETPPAVSREAQKVGLFVAFFLYGLTWAALIASVVHLLRLARVRQVVLATLAVAWGTAIFPFLKYPASPPGVGDPDSLLFRQVTYMLSLAIGVAGVAGAYALAKRVGTRKAVAALVALMVAAFLILPPNPDSASLAPEFLLAFRARSLGGLLIFWAVFTATFAWLFPEGSGQEAESSRQ